MLFSATTIQRFLEEGEDAFNDENNCIIKRVALSVTSGTPEYTISDSILNIRRITWKGKKLDPLTTRDARVHFQNMGQLGQPFWYLFNNIESNKIRFFPSPNETVASITTNLYGSEIPNRVIIEYYSTTNSTTILLPSYFRRRLLKSYVLKSCFQIEGQGQNLKAAQYFDKKFKTLSVMYNGLLNELHNKPRKLVLQGMASTSYFPGRPVWPIDRFGTGVDRGE